MGIGSLLLKRSLICAGRETMAAPSSSKYKVVVGYVSFLLMFFLSRQPPCSAVYSISYSEPLLYNQTLVSPNHIFELGFFTPHGTSNQYVGMWFKNLTPTKVVWVANRDRPLRSDDRFACLTIGSDGNMRLVDGHQNTVWSTDVQVERSNGYTAALLDTGNLVLRSDGDTGTSIWESFDHPTDTLLAEMKIGINVKTGEKRYLTSWKTDTDPSPGMVSLGLTAEVPTQPFIWNGSAPLWRGGQWDQSKFIGVSTMDGRYLNGHIVQQDVLKGTTYFSYELPGSYIGYLFVSHGGSMKFLMWNPISQNWIPIWGEPHDPCEAYGTCGPFGICRIRSGFSSCDCVRGFAPKSEEEWKRRNWRGGCVRKHGLHCVAGPAGITDRFWKVSRLKLPDRSIYLRDVSTKTECEGWCLRNCSCVAYSFVEAIGCMVWTGELMDIKDFNGTGEDLFLRLARRKRDAQTKVIVSLTTITSIIILGASMCVIGRRRSKKPDAPVPTERGKMGLQREMSSELPLIDLRTVLLATDNFCTRNKLGQGGFGPVYKGTLPEGTEIAVKRLSSSSGQGVEEFKNEIILISKLQHRNLVKLIGCCMEGEERILVYEYLPNKSLDTFLFDPRRKGELTWKKRFDIIHGISRGLMYLHRDSCLRIIHRDLKASNILLDEEMNPKISDFGLARMFEATQDLVNTRRVVGTIGYMSPEYAIRGMFSEKSDVYSFGVLILEIISGRRSTSFCCVKESQNLLSYAWELWKEGKGVNLLDEAIISADSINSTTQEVMKCMQIGLLCIQDHAVDRPNMPTVVMMLSGETDLPHPKAPSFTDFHVTWDQEYYSQQGSNPSINMVTCSVTQGR